MPSDPAMTRSLLRSRVRSEEREVTHEGGLITTLGRERLVIVISDTVDEQHLSAVNYCQINLHNFPKR